MSTPVRVIHVHAHMPKAAAPWRSIRIVVPIGYKPDGEYGPVWIKRKLGEIATKLGLDPKRRVHRQHRTTIGSIGYLHVYRGDNPTPREKRLFHRALRMVERIKVKS